MSDEYSPKNTKLPPHVRRLSGTMMLRFADALKKLDEPAAALDQVRERARDLVTDEEKKSIFPRPITLIDPVEMESAFPLPPKAPKDPQT